MIPFLLKYQFSGFTMPYMGLLHWRGRSLNIFLFWFSAFSKNFNQQQNELLQLKANTSGEFFPLSLKQKLLSKFLPSAKLFLGTFQLFWNIIRGNNNRFTWWDRRINSFSFNGLIQSRMFGERLDHRLLFGNFENFLS